MPRRKRITSHVEPAVNFPPTEHLWSFIEERIGPLQTDIRELRQAQREDNQRLNERIDEVGKTVTAQIDTQTKNLTDHFDKGISSIGDKYTAVAKRVRNLERWRYLIAGATAAVMFIGGLIVKLLTLK